MAQESPLTETPGDPKWVAANAKWQVLLKEGGAYAGWKAQLSGLKVDGFTVPIDLDKPFTGFYRMKKVDKVFVPVAFWYEGKKLRCLIGDDEEREDYVSDIGQVPGAREVWTYCCKYPITHAVYLKAVETGEWPDSDPRLTSKALKQSGDYGPGEEATTNNPPAETPLEECRNKIANAKGGVADYVTIADDEQLARAKSLKNRLTELGAEADNKRKELKAPHWEAAKAVDEEWMPVVNEAKAAANFVQYSMNNYATAQLQARRAAEAEAEARRLTEVGNEPAAEEVAPAPIEEKTTRVQPGYGRAGSIKTYTMVMEITDIDLLFGFLKTHKELRIKMEELAQRAVDAGHDVPGVRVEERAKVR